MILLYYYMVLLSAATALVVAVAAFWRNRYQAVGPLFGIAMLVVSAWFFGFARYFRPMDEARALAWAEFTLGAGMLGTPFLFHSMCALVGRMRRYGIWIAVAYGLTLGLLLLLWQGLLIDGVRWNMRYMDHYLRYNLRFLPLVNTHVVFWQFAGVAILVFNIKRATGYKRIQLIYFVVAWFIVFLTTNLIIVPLGYDINILPVGYFLLPLNLAFLAYVMAKARLADPNVAIARVLVYAFTLLIVVAISLVFAAGVELVAPGFMNPGQMAFTIGLVVGISLLLAAVLPRWLPQAERMVQERLFAARYGYQDALMEVMRTMSRLPEMGQVLSTLAISVQSQMQLTRALILIQDAMSGDYRVEAQSGLDPHEPTEALGLDDDSAVVRWLRESREVLVRDELPRRVPGPTMDRLTEELNRLKVSVCVPMIVEGWLIGVLCLGEKTSRGMFYVADLRLLETLASEASLAVRYRRMQEEVVRKNKLSELGTVAAGVAHEIRNPLASIKTFAQLLPSKAADPEFRDEFSKLVVKDIERISKVVESMLAFARPPEVKVADYQVAELIDEAVLLVEPRLKSKGIPLTKEVASHFKLKVDKQQILQVLLNLLNNAVDALGPEGTIRIGAKVRTLKSFGVGGQRQDIATIEVTDNGVGIPAAVRQRVFEPFFTTKKEGTGLGLSISQKIVHDHGGVITVSSVEGKGTTFQIHLPLRPPGA
jgi:signal transduction histidine kinase